MTYKNYILICTDNYERNQQLHDEVNDPSEHNQDLQKTKQPAKTDNIEWIGKECKHVWIMSIKHRINGQNCPYCAGKRALPGFNDLKTYGTKYIHEYSPKNKELPEYILYKSAKKILWKCLKSHEWLATPEYRSRVLGHAENVKVWQPYTLNMSKNGTQTIKFKQKT